MPPYGSRTWTSASREGDLSAAGDRQMDIDATAGRQDAVLGESLLHGSVDLAPEDELPAGPRRELGADQQRIVIGPGDPLRLERLDEVLADVRAGQEIAADLLEQSADQLDVGVERQPEVQLHDRPVAAVVGELVDLAERDRCAARRDGGEA